MRVLFFGTYDAGRHPRIRTIQEGVAAAGHDVVVCNAPLGLDTAARLQMLQHPWRVPLLGARLVARWWRLWRSARHLPTPDAVIVGYLGHFDVHLARWLWPRRPIALDHLVSARDTAVDRGVRTGWILSVLGRLDRSALRAADVPFVDTDEQLGTLPEAGRRRAIVVAVGAPAAWFREPPTASPPEEPLSVIFFGLYTPLQGASVIGRALAALAGDGVRITMVGHGQDLPATRTAARDNPDVTWIDWVDPDGLPSLVGEHDVCLGIFGETPKALRVVPNKVYQGAAAGCAIVTSDTKPQRRALGDAAVYVPPGDADALADALRGLAGRPDELAAYRAAARTRADEAFRPGVVVTPLLERLGEIRR